MLTWLCSSAESRCIPACLRLVGISSKRQTVPLMVKRVALTPAFQWSRGKPPRADECSTVLPRNRMEFPAAMDAWTNASLSKDGVSLKSKVWQRVALAQQLKLKSLYSLSAHSEFNHVAQAMHPHNYRVSPPYCGLTPKYEGPDQCLVSQLEHMLLT